MHVLIADDNATNLKLLRALLEAEGHQVSSAVDGVEALAVLQKEKIDAIISDILMPRMDGYRFCHEVRQSENFGELPFLFYTSTYTSSADEKTAMKLGADRFLKKPAPTPDIINALNEAFEKGPHRRLNIKTPSDELGLMKEYSARLVAKLEKKNLELEEAAREATESREQLRALAARLQAAREEERIRIAREIHDDFGELLVGLKLGLGWLRERLDKLLGGRTDPELLRKIASLGALADGTTIRVRKICSDLRPSILDDLGLVAAIEWHAQEFQKRTNIRCETTINEKHIVASSDQATALFRIFQEILTNIARHSQASKVRVLLKAQGTNLLLEVKDNGCGIEPDRLSGTGSLGLLGMRERAAVLKGRVDIQGQRGRGTTVTVTIPIATPRDNVAI